MPLRRSPPRYISVSRRTDIPRFYWQHFYQAWQKGAITYDGGYGRNYTVSLKREDVLGYIFWSKDFRPFISDPRFTGLIAAENAVFHFTVNHCPPLEPRLASLESRFETLAALCALVGPERVLWRYDPLCRYQFPGGKEADNVEPFFELLPRMARLGISRCYFSFMTPYAKLKDRKVRFIPMRPEEGLSIAARMRDAAVRSGITLHNCCNPEIPERIPEIRTGSCVDSELLERTDRFGRHRPLAKKSTRTGCGCYESRDIGSYLQKCPHGCLYCYANPCFNRDLD